MDKHEDKGEVTPDDKPIHGQQAGSAPADVRATDRQACQEDEPDGTASGAEEPATGAEKESKIISKGKASLIISGVEEARSEAEKPQPLVVEPRVTVARVDSRDPVDEETDEATEAGEQVQRLENSVNPGKERIKVDQAKFEKLEQRPDEAEIQEEQWGSGISPGWWVALAGGGAAVLLLGGLALESWFDGDEVQTVVEPPAYVPEPDPHEGSPEQWFHQRAGRINVDARAVLSAFMAAKDDEARSKYVRFPERYLQRPDSQAGQINPRLEQIDTQAYDIAHTEDVAFLTLDCQDTDFMPFRAYFTRDGDRLKIDWEATVAQCDVSLKKMHSDIKEQQLRIEEIKRKHRLAQADYAAAVRQRSRAIEARRLQDIRKKEATTPKLHVVAKGETIEHIARKYQVSVKELMTVNQLATDLLQISQTLKIPGLSAPPAEEDIVVPPEPKPVAAAVLPAELYTEPMLVRCMVRRRDEFYAGPYNDKLHSAFMIISADRVQSMWAYTKRDSPLDLELRRLLDHGRFVVDLKKDLRVTLRVRRAQKDALPSQLELVELIHPEWVTP
ncbi:MAG: LysM peptidoglycan-binding domain-containing protein [Akkermansiaceae bacterium]|nr:LysM peptidoglycan-binding domain-containing protein [Akkermansiaceae bacterium]